MTWALSPTFLLSWGGEVRVGRASYDYHKNERTLVASGGQAVPVIDDLLVATKPSGTMTGLFANMRFQPIGRVTLDLGGRVDHQSYTNERQLSPRIGVAITATDRTTIRAAWGRYSQPEGLHELQTQDGVTRFDTAELAEHRVAGIAQDFDNGISARAEVYERRMQQVRPRFVSVDNSVDVFPEIEPDRLLIAPSSSLARGVELLVNRTPGHRVTWSASYALAEANDVIGGVTVPRTLDQRHTITLDFGWRPSPRWQFSGAWLYHSGWPTTGFTFAADTLADKRILVRRLYAARNDERLSAYHRLDFRVTRDVVIRTTRLSIFGDLFNVYDRKNARAYDPTVSVVRGQVVYAKRVDSLMPRLPSFGVSWEF